MFGNIIRCIRSWIERFKAKIVVTNQPIETTVNQKLVEDCLKVVSRVQDKLHLKYSPLEARLVFVRSTHPNISEFTKFLRKINDELKAEKPKFLSSDFPYEFGEFPLDSFFVSTAGNYIPQSAIGEFVIETITLLGFVKTLAQEEAGIGEYHFRMLLKTISSLTSIHGAISTVLAD